MTAKVRAELKCRRFWRSKQERGAFVWEALKARGLMSACEARPAYQQNDHLGWISRAKHQAAKGG